MPDDRHEAMLEHFLQHELPDTSIEQAIRDLAQEVADHVERGPERTVFFRKLLEARDCLRRAF